VLDKLTGNPVVHCKKPKIQDMWLARCEEFHDNSSTTFQLILLATDRWWYVKPVHYYYYYYYRQMDKPTNLEKFISPSSLLAGGASPFSPQW